jgi:hypothetical protein
MELAKKINEIFIQIFENRYKEIKIIPKIEEKKNG